MELNRSLARSVRGDRDYCEGAVLEERIYRAPERDDLRMNGQILDLVCHRNSEIGHDPCQRDEDRKPGFEWSSRFTVRRFKTEGSIDARIHRCKDSLMQGFIDEGFTIRD
jgi:hypothetical protein